MTGAGTSGSSGSGVLRGAGALNLGGAFGFICTFDNWLNGVPVIGFGDGTFGSWLNGVPVCEPGGASVLPNAATAGCSGTGKLVALLSAASGTATCTGSGSLKGAGALHGTGSGGCTGAGTCHGSGSCSGSGRAGCSGTGILRGAGKLTGSGTAGCSGSVSPGFTAFISGNGFSGCSGTGILTGIQPTPTARHRIVSPVQPKLRHFDPVNDKWWSRRVSAREETQRVFN